MSQPRIRQLFESRLATWAAARVPALPIAYQNAPFDPPVSTYLRAFLLPARTDSEDMQGDHRQYMGIFQVSVVGAVNVGSGAAEAIAEEIATLFPNNLRLSIVSPAFTVQLITPMSIAQSIEDADRFTVPVSAQYRSDTI